jgi:hypothetical protein
VGKKRKNEMARACRTWVWLAAALMLVHVATVSAAAVESKESGRVLAKLETFCRDKCRQRLALEDGCSHFCGFVNHIRIAHEEDIYALYREGQRNIQPLVFVIVECKGGGSCCSHRSRRCGQ